MPKSDPIYLIGFMGCGKTTLGRALEACAGVHFVDLDEAVEATAGMPITEIFAQKGEAAFRSLEGATLKAIELHPGRPTVIACGGGTPCHGDAMDFMLRRGLVVWLDASEERTLARLLEAQARRPLLAGKSPAELLEYIRQTRATRATHYSRAHLRFDSSHLDTAEELERTVAEFIKTVTLTKQT